MESKQKELIHQEIEKKIDDLLQKMTLKEKIGQMTQQGPSLVGGFDLENLIGKFANGEISSKEFEEIQKQFSENLHEDLIEAGEIGSFLGASGAEKINRLQKIAVEKSRLGIPLLFGMDVIHGYRTIFPTPLAESCCWDLSLMEKSARIAAKEASADGIRWTFSPMVDICRDARWGRICEGGGEDSYLTSEIAKAKVHGYQTDDVSKPDSIAACAKHFAAYGAAEAGRDYNTTDMSLQKLYEVYLPPFKAACDARALSFMTSFNDLNGIPSSVNKFLLDDVLREDFGFNGLVVSDSNAIAECITHGAAQDGKDAAAKALKAGTDMDMSSDIYKNNLKNLVESGQLPVEYIDRAVRRILRVKFLLGLFDNPYTDENKWNEIKKETAEYRQIAREIAKKSIVLLKNDGGLLPLDKTKTKIALIGELADSKKDMLGAWAFTGDENACVTVLEGLKNAVSSPSNIVYAKGCFAFKENDFDLDSALEAAKNCDVIIAVMGEPAFMSGEASSRANPVLPGRQRELLTALKETGKPIVLVLMNGRPLALDWENENIPAILEAWHLGSEAGNAIADVIFGDFNPSGKLTTTFPYCTGQIPIYYNHPNTGRPATDFKFTSKYLDAPVEPLYPFGYGLSYTEFKYSDFSISKTAIAPKNDSIFVSAKITNTGEIKGDEIVQLYIRDISASRVRPIKELKAFKKISLNPGETKEVEFEIVPEMLSFYNERLEKIIEKGKFKVWIAPNSALGLEGDFEVI